MLPYILLALTAPWEFRYLKAIEARRFLLLSFLLGLCTSFLLCRYGRYIYGHRLLYMVSCWFHFQFPFLLGMASARRGGPKDLISLLTDRVKAPVKSILYKSLPLLLFLIIIVRCVFTSSVLHSVYVFLFVMILVDLRLPDCVKRILAELGNRSVGMWFVHTSIGLYLFADCFNLLQYPLLIFIAVSFVSWMTSVGICFLCNYLINAAYLIYHRLSR